MVAVQQDIEVEQGITFELAVEELDDDGVTPRDLSGYTGAMQIRPSEDSDVVLATAVVELSTGLVLATIDDAVTATYTWRVGVYDLEITNGSRTDRIARGTARLTRQVTRP